MRVVVTGGSGFTGQRVVPRLLDNGHQVFALARSPAAISVIHALGATPLPGNLDDVSSLAGAFKLANADVLVNLASLGFGHAPAIISATRGAGIWRAVFVSTTAVFTRLATRSKPIRLEAERLVEASGLSWTVIRPTMIYGAPGDRNMSRLLTSLRRSAVFPLPGGGGNLQQPVHVGDLARAIVTAATVPSAVGAAYEVAGPEPIAFRQIVNEAAAAVGCRPRYISIPLKPTIAAVRLYERVSPRPRVRAEQLERLAENKAYDISAARRDLGHDPRPFARGIAEEAALMP